MPAGATRGSCFRIPSPRRHREAGLRAGFAVSALLVAWALSAPAFAASAPDGWDRGAAALPAAPAPGPDEWRDAEPLRSPWASLPSRWPGRFSVRWGLHAGPAGEAAAPLLALGWRTGPASMLFVEQEMGRDVGDLSSGLPIAAPAFATQRVGVEFKLRRARPAWRDFGTLRIQVGLQGQLVMRPRSHGLKVSWRYTF